MFPRKYIDFSFAYFSITPLAHFESIGLFVMIIHLPLFRPHGVDIHIRCLLGFHGHILFYTP